MKSNVFVALLCIALLSSGCATKRYGRLQPVTAVETAHYTCEDIKVELARIDAFELQVAEGAEFDMLSVASFLGDFGIGNVMERDAAIKTAKERRVQLNDVSANKGCQ